jgi:hypothetical protein
MMQDSKIRAITDNYSDVPMERKRLIDTGRKPLPLVRFPTDLDFSKTIGGTTYTVRSHFNRDAGECLFAKVNRLMLGDPDLRENEGEEYDD